MFRQACFTDSDQGNAADLERLKKIDSPSNNWMKKLGPFQGLADRTLDAYLDTSAGITYADKACVWARHLCEKQGVKFVLGPQQGKLARVIIEGEGRSKKARGIETVDGKRHKADVVVVACELPWICNTDKQVVLGRQVYCPRPISCSKQRRGPFARSSCPAQGRTYGRNTVRSSSQHGRMD